MKTYILATHNRDKIKEFKNKLGSKICLKTLEDYPDLPNVIEDGETLENNAFKKAHEIHVHTGLPTIADDTGLEVDALNGAPGIYSSRFAGENATYQDNVNKLLSGLKGLKQEQRNARFRTSIAFVDGEERWSVQGSVEGRILDQQRGKDGFGYDPVFYYEPLQKTFSELDLDTKNKISHRGKAIDAFIHKLKELNHI
ncbi:MAG: RdgB/HAM1 family non-canonical purine NTP pyrophosphatase [Candidatus Marinimicrobia bacterium]|nr:RdgB/HAM1 family non-canonical purine NTP pyrophosphatase [Candidatus Neomarinimicrobiota bacterium]